MNEIKHCQNRALLTGRSNIVLPLSRHLLTHHHTKPTVLPGQDGALSIRTVPQLDEEPAQTREHLFKVCPEWKARQKILWAEVRKETGR